MPIDHYQRYQKHYKMSEMFPDREDGTCACGCGVKLTGRKRRWASRECNNKAASQFWIVKGDVQRIREALVERDAIDGEIYCKRCNHHIKTGEDWHADHIKEVRHGGGGCTLDNFQILCTSCHKKKTKANYEKDTITLPLFDVA